MGPISIMNLEQRADVANEFRKLKSYIETEEVHWNGTTIRDFIDLNFKAYPFVGTSNNLEEYFSDRSIDLNENLYSLLIYSNFILTVTYWMKLHAVIRYDDEWELKGRRINYSVLGEIESHIKSLLELFNYQAKPGYFDKGKMFHEVLFTKRNADVDSVLPLVDSDTRLDLLSYLDFRFENNLDAKVGILKRLGKYLEPDRKSWEEIDKNLTDSVFSFLNNFNIRHNNSHQVTFENNKEELQFCDDGFYLILHLIRTKKIKEIQENISEKIKQNKTK